jgi:hypothetical protein
LPPERLGQDGCNRFFASFLLQPTLYTLPPSYAKN